MRVSIILLLLTVPGFSWACSISCPPLEKYYELAKYVFIGKVNKVEEYGINWFRDEPKIKVFFDISKNWKGTWGGKPLRTTHNKYSCDGYFFEENVAYVIFIFNEDNFGLCDAIPHDAQVEAEIDEISNQK